MISMPRLVSFLALSLAAGSAFSAAAPPSTGLGQAWPNATDVSVSPRYHVYVFERHGIRYVQVNDLNGTVRAAFGTAAGDVFALPIGMDADRLVTLSEPVAAATAATGETVYRDENTSVNATPLSDGGIRMLVVGTCDNPAQCSIQGH
ncbi:hypothetical protein FHW69_003820 [Luteibacter sp. Sphag1AF]|uniref:hypothetical protein n=1 Tax=Luteibacter sp. Sphag1AF TaxID=2587031 RepID=UPI00179E44BF|nr:hypothetical protein [Luteibacter sp. Sphag1AF]MBB3229166.1 hypothetical protein [Luteibacter sp. Sphag1AF]